MGRPRRATRQEQSDTTRRLLVDVSLELFVRRGYAGATVRQIAAKAGISTGLMFHYFSSKQALLEEHIGVVERGIHAVAGIVSDQRKRPWRHSNAITEMICTRLKTATLKISFSWPTTSALTSIPSCHGQAPRQRDEVNPGQCARHREGAAKRRDQSWRYAGAGSGLLGRALGHCRGVGVEQQRAGKRG